MQWGSMMATLALNELHKRGLSETLGNISSSKTETNLEHPNILA